MKTSIGSIANRFGREAAPADSAMRISAIDVFELDIPFADGGEDYGAASDRWQRLECIYLRVRTAGGLIGWGECFAYGCRAAVSAALRDMVIPLAIGCDAGDPEGTTGLIQKKLHLFGRYGIAMFAISGLDIALWDIRAQALNRPLFAALGFGEGVPDAIEAYASLVHYGSARAVRAAAGRAVEEGYCSVKLHEPEMDCIRAGRSGAGFATHFTLDFNCRFTLEEALSLGREWESVNPAWVEEPIYPPEDLAALLRISLETGLKLSSGENACTRYEFSNLISSGAIAFPQPSVTKVGGISEAVAILAQARSQGLTCMLHSPYIGPGYVATLHLLPLTLPGSMFEYLYVTPAAQPSHDAILPEGGRIAVRDAPGLGFKPDWSVFDRYAVNTYVANTEI